MGEPIHVLLVDDNEDLLGTLCQILKRKGFFVETAADGLSAVDRYLQGDFNVTLMDIIMPDISGVEAFRLIREIDPAAPIVMMTGYSDEDLIRSAIDEGACNVLYKPLRVDQMVEAITKAALASPSPEKEPSLAV
jgi:DNA-binding NtrC family response regulator